MVAYEVLLMLDPELPEEREIEILTRMRQQIERNGTWSGHERWGRRKLAYEIDHKSEGVYHLVTFTTEPATLTEVSRILKITDGVMRHMPVRLRERAGKPVGGDGARRESTADPVDEDAAATTVHDAA